MKWRTDEQLGKIMVLPEDTLLESLPKMDQAALQVLLVVDKFKQLVGIITDGDVRRALLHGLDQTTQLKHIMNINPHSLPVTASIADAKRLIQQLSIRHIPLVNEQGVLEDLIVWSDCFEAAIEKRSEQVVIMAGGKGTRLDPFTKILPKPMIPLGDKPIIEIIMDKFYQQGFSEFILSLGYKAEIIKMYFSELNGRPYQTDFVCEKQQLGTAGSLSLLKNQLDGTFLVTNCDVILELNCSNLLKHHKTEENDLTLVGSVKEFSIPYGVIETEGQNLVKINEKPNFHFLVNTGLYVLEPRVLELIGENEPINMTDLFLRIKEKGGKVGVYPHHGKWFDVGQWEEYRQTVRFLEST